MGTIDDILKTSPQRVNKTDGSGPGTAVNAGGDSGKGGDPSNGGNVAKNTGTVADVSGDMSREPDPKTDGETEKLKSNTDVFWDAMLDKDYKEAEEKLKKRQKAAAIISAIGDGLTAISNLYFATKGVHQADRGKSLSEGARVSYERLIKDFNEDKNNRINWLMKANVEDNRRAKEDREWKRLLGKDDQDRKDREEDIRHRDEREKIEDERWDKRFEEEKQRSKRSHELAVKRQEDNAKLQRQRLFDMGTKGLLGKPIGFSDGDGNQVRIYENVWKGSMQQVYDVLYEDMNAAHIADKRKNPRVPRHTTSKGKDDFVKQNWHKSPRAVALMLSLSRLDPNTMQSGIEAGVETVDYDPSAEDDVIDYVPDKK